MITGRAIDRTWPVKTRENVDLWLHGFALLSNDSSAAIPLFRRGYRDELTVLKNRANVLTQLDANHDRLANGLAASRTLGNAQFLPYYFQTVDQMRGAIDRFIAVNGDPNGARSQDEAAALAVLASYFPSPADRTWLALFASAMWDEDAKFYHSYWTQQNRERVNVVDSTQAMWQHFMRPRIQRYLTNTNQREADIVLSLPLGGEGRTLNGDGVARNSIGVTFPDRPSDVPQVMYAIAHEIVGDIANHAITDNTTPADLRSGVGDRLSTIASVRGGLMLIEKFTPELADGYARYYLAQSGRTPGANPRTQLVAAFPLPNAIRDAMTRQIDMVNSGI